MSVTRVRLALLIALALTTQALGEWSQFRGDARHSGYAAGAFNVENTYQLWHLPMSSASDIAIQNDALYVTQSWYSSATVSRIDLYSGEIQWSKILPFDSSHGVSAPTVQGDKVYVHRWGHSSSSGSTGPTDKPALVGLDATNGQQLFATNHSGQWSSGSRPTVSGDLVFAAGGYYGGLDAYSLSGTSKWFAKVNQQYGWIPAADSQNVYVYMGEASASPGPSVGRLYIANQRTGSLTYINHPRSTGTRSRTSDDGSVMLDGLGNAYALSSVSTVNYGSTLVSFDTAAGTINWEADGNWSDNPATANGIIALAEGKSLVFLDADTGARSWSWNHSGYVYGSVVLTDHLAFVNTATGVFAIDLESRMAIWNTPLKGTIAASDKFLYITNDTGIYAISAVPEPSAAVILVSATVSVFASLRRRTSGF